MYVHLKQSGELLAAHGKKGELWTPDGVRSSVEKAAMAYESRRSLGMKGLMLVSGAGNIIRGQELRAHGIADGQADLLGRLATIQNTLVLAQGLRSRGVPTVTFLADSMELADRSLNGDLKTYDVDEVRNAYDDERIVLVGGGTGEDNVTTDHAVMAYAAKHIEADPGADVIVLKGTKHDGVYDSDPAKDARARRYTEISAQLMLDDYDRFAAVDKSCLEQIVETGLSMQLYRDGAHDLTYVLEGHNGSVNRVGTLIVSSDDPDYEPKVA